MSWVSDEAEVHADVADAVSAERKAAGWPTRCRALVDVGFSCTRNEGHAGRHLATGMVGVVAAWPGAAAPSLTDLTDVPS